MQNIPKHWRQTDKMISKVLAIITARGGSKGLPRKNILMLAGKPLIAHTIDAAKKSNIFDTIVVTTDDDQIKNISQSYGASIIDRPNYLATDAASSLDVVNHTLDTLEESNYSHFILLQPTSPLRSNMHIKEAWEKYIKKNANTLVSVTLEVHSPFKLLVKDKINGSIKPLFNVEYLTSPRQALPKAYRPNGAIYISRIDTFLETRNLFEESLEIYEMDEESSIDIDTEQDMQACKNLLT